jgi:hypothetical protein
MSHFFSIRKNRKRKKQKESEQNNTPSPILIEQGSFPLNNFHSNQPQKQHINYRLILFFIDKKEKIIERILRT